MTGTLENAARVPVVFDLPLAEISTDENTERAHLAGVGALTLLSHDYGEAHMPVSDMIAEGVTLLVGASKIGKSYLMLDMCLKVACGEPFLGMETQKCPVWYYALEDSPRRMRKRLLQLLGGSAREDIADVTFIFEARTISDGFLEALELKLASRRAEGKRLPGMIVIDTLQVVRGVSSAAVNAYAADYQTIRRLKETARRFRLAVVLVHHTNKLHASEDCYERVSGSTGLTGAADSTILIERKRGESAARVSGVGRDILFNDFGMEFREGTWKRLNESPAAQNQAVDAGNDPFARTLALAHLNAGGLISFHSYESLKALCEVSFGVTPFLDGRGCARLINRLAPVFREEFMLALEAGAASAGKRGVKIRSLPAPAFAPYAHFRDECDDCAAVFGDSEEAAGAAISSARSPRTNSAG